MSEDEAGDRYFPKDVECPACGAEPGEFCTPIGTGYNRLPHGKRQGRAHELNAGRSQEGGA